MYMYAYDMVLFSESIEGLKSLLNELLKDCKAYGSSVHVFTINVKKSKALLFRKGSKSKPGEHWQIL